MDGAIHSLGEGPEGCPPGQRQLVEPRPLRQGDDAGVHEGTPILEFGVDPVIGKHVITVKRIGELAQQALSSPWGMGHRELRDNPECWAPYYKFLYLCIQEYRPKLVVELGTYLGTGAEHMALANHNTLVIAVDIAPQPRAYNVAEYYSNVELYVGDSCIKAIDVAALCHRDNLHIGLLFIDSVHDGETPTKEFQAYASLLGDEAIIACDDLLGPEHLKVKMQQFWEWLPCEKVELHELHPYPSNINPTPGFGVGIWRRDDSRFV